MPPELIALIMQMAGGAGMGGATAGIEALPTMLRTKEDKYNAAELKKLEADRANGGFGLNSSDKALLSQSYTAPGLKQLNDTARAPVSGLAGGGVAGVSGDQIAKQIMAASARGSLAGSLQGQAAGAVRAADLAQIEQKKQELEARTAYQAARRTQQLQAGLSMLTGGIGGATSAAQEAKTTTLQNLGQPAVDQSSQIRAAAPPASMYAPAYNPYASMVGSVQTAAAPPPVATELQGVPSSIDPKLFDIYRSLGIL